MEDDSLVIGAVQIIFQQVSRNKALSRFKGFVHGLHLAAHFSLTGATGRLLKISGPCVQDHARRTPLHRAARNGHFLLVKLLGEKGADINAQVKEGIMALILVLGHGYADTVSTLIELGCGVNISNNTGDTALMRAVAGGRESILDLLLLHGADPQAPTSLGTTPLMTVVLKNNERIVRILLEHGVVIDSLDKNGWCSALLAATTNSNEAIMRLLLETGARPDLEMCYGTTALQRAVTRRAAGPMRLLLEFGADPNGKDGSGKTPLRSAAIKGNLATMSVLMPVTQLQTVDNQGETILHAAINSDNEERNGEAVRFLLNTGKMDIEAINANGWSALTRATYGGLPKISQLLLDTGANPELQVLARQALEALRPSLSKMQRCVRLADLYSEETEEECEE